MKNSQTMNNIKLFFALLLTASINAQGNINGNITGATQQALIDFGNRSSRAPQPLNIQGSHYFDAEFKSTKLEYFGKELVWDTTKPMGDMKRLMSTERAESYGFKAKTTLKEGIEKTIEWYLEKNK